MNANIFEFQNREILMQFNPLFLPTNSFVDNTGNAKTFKISNSSYLFSDIIKVIAGSNSTENLQLTQNNTSKQVLAGNENIFSLPARTCLEVLF